MNGPRLVALETTRRCNLHCIHCRASAETGTKLGTLPSLKRQCEKGKSRAEREASPILSPFPPELTTEEIYRLFDELAERVRPIVILTGGEPLLRADIFEIARRGAELGFHMTMAPNGTLMDETAARRMVESGIRRIAISLDAASAGIHDAFRRMPGAFAGAMRGIEAARKAALPFQINTSVTAFNAGELPKVHELARSLGAAAHHIFMLVRVGRGRELDAELPPAEQERVLHWLYERHREGLIAVRATCAPHYFRILAQGEDQEARKIGAVPEHPTPTSPLPSLGGEGKGEGRSSRAGRRKMGTVPSTEKGGQSPFSALQTAITRGCTAGDRFVFISSTAHVQPCGYLDIDCGDIRREGFWKIWDGSPVLRVLRDGDRLKGRCGLCDFRRYCGGCRARAYAASGDYLAEDPACLYRPKGIKD